MRNRGNRLAAGMLTGVVLLTAAACGSSDDDKDTSTSATSATVKSYDKSVAGVVEAANAFLATLDDTEKAAVNLEFTQANAVAWSNLPCGSSCRPGIRFGSLDDEELAAAKSVLMTALGTGTSSGYNRVTQILLADDYLGSIQGSSGASGGPGGGGDMPSGGPDGGMSGGPGGGMSGGPGGGMSGGPGGGAMPSGGGMGSADSGYSSDTYFMAFLGTPSADGTWQLHFGGHHLAVDMTYKAGQVAGASPFFVGVEPTSWTADSTEHAPLEDMKTALLAMTGSLSEAEQKKAKLSQTFTDVLVGPGEDGRFPATKQGLAAGSLTDEQKKLVLAAVEPWVAGADDATAATLMSTYESELDKTYIGWSGTTGLTAHADYVRIDGPSVWVEFVCQNGIVIQDQIHYHTVYRDHTRDYGGEFTFS
ncbi:DUF3500 domain-containing protein [Actinoplanes sp. NBRC 101535]|uniref:DUF3500 domain-containing protein n=1 Tax=Actinoplanes sp. NBRC 101535 TaxID=3032196 RepID=UPI0024A10081|nr:DUF3500 domain-containing protein [Actinoplanes sp. NBRC 101535]GLY00166.1 hypothetical protein Acsp01_05450 [Actinoplanes sp. NBRC 101535]